jgi:hypothetical protein
VTAYNIINPASLTAGQPEDISVVLANLQAIASIINGSLDDSNIAPSAALAISKLAGYPTDGAKVLKGDGSWGSVTSGYGTALPSSPIDGQEHILVDSLTAPTYQWRFRYNAGNTSAYKWEFIGGPPFAAYDASAAVNGSGAHVGIGPGFPVPRQGVYVMDYLANVYASTTGGATASLRWQTWPGAVVIPGSDIVEYYCQIGQGPLAASFKQTLTLTLTPNEQVLVALKNVAQNVTSRWRTLVVTPVRVS